MRNKAAFIQEILEDIYNLPNPKLEESRKTQIKTVIDNAINGDSTREHLSIDVLVSKETYIYVYVLTAKRLIVFAISPKNEVNSNSFSLQEMQKVNFNSPEPAKMSIEIVLSNGNAFGLKYSEENKSITSFFQKLDQQLINKT
jgi:hypothetical protein